MSASTSEEQAADFKLGHINYGGISGRSAHGNPNRGAVMHCPYCGGENLWPDIETDYAWQCQECCRVFTVKLHGHVARRVAPGREMPAAHGDSVEQNRRGTTTEKEVA